MTFLPRAVLTMSYFYPDARHKPPGNSYPEQHSFVPVPYTGAVQPYLRQRSFYTRCFFRGVLRKQLSPRNIPTALQHHPAHHTPDHIRGLSRPHRDRPTDGIHLPRPLRIEAESLAVIGGPSRRSHLLHHRAPPCPPHTTPHPRIIEAGSVATDRSTDGIHLPHPPRTESRQPPPKTRTASADYRGRIRRRWRKITPQELRRPPDRDRESCSKISSHPYVTSVSHITKA